MSEYERTAIREDFLSLSEDEKKALIEKLKAASVQVDDKTFGLYKVANRVRYDIEPLTDAAARG